MANPTTGLTDDQKFNLDIEYRQALSQWAKADNTYDRALDEYASQPQPVVTDMCQVAESL